MSNSASKSASPDDSDIALNANQAKSDFLSSMSHELRAPLGAILGFAQLLESGAPQPTLAQRRSIEQSPNAGWYLLELIDEILDLALIESGHLSLSLEAISLGQVLDECRTMIEPQAKQRGIRLSFPEYVEDNAANLTLVAELVGRRPDLRLLSAREGRTGIDIARRAQPDVILMDINLPDISGIRALQILSSDPKTAHIPVIALSANAMPRDIRRGLDAGFFRYLTKPIKVTEFMETLDNALRFSETGPEAPIAEQHA